MATARTTYPSATERAHLADRTFTVLEEVTGERRGGTADDLRTVMRRFDALPEYDYLLPTISARGLEPLADDVERHIDSVIAGFAVANRPRMASA